MGLRMLRTIHDTMAYTIAPTLALAKAIKAIQARISFIESSCFNSNAGVRLVKGVLC